MRASLWGVTASLIVLASAARVSAQAPRASSPGGGTVTTARIETEPLEPNPPERFLQPAVVEPARRIVLMAPDDGYIQLFGAKVGDEVRDRQEIVALDRSEASARLKIAQADAKEAQAKRKAAQTAQADIFQAELEAAQARVELAQLALDSRSIKAPFTGRLLSLSVSPGQFVTKGTALGEIADLAGLRVMVPVDRHKVKQGDKIELDCEGKTVAGKVLALLPLASQDTHLRELAIPWSIAFVSLEAGADSGIEPGQRVWSSFLPRAPIAVVASRAIHDVATIQGGKATAPAIQVLRNERVVSIPARILGEVGPDRLQISGYFRASDVVIVASSVTLADGTFVRFTGSSESGDVETVPPDPNAPGNMARVSAPPTAEQPANRVAPIGAPDSALPKASRSRPSGSPPSSATPARPANPAPQPSGSSNPF